MRRNLSFLSSAILVALFFSACIPTYRPPTKLANLTSGAIALTPHLTDPGDIAIDGNKIIHVARLQCVSGSIACVLVYEQYLLGSLLLQRVIPPAQDRSAANPQLAVDPTGKVHLAWEECPAAGTFEYCNVLYRRVVPDSPAIRVGTNEMQTEPGMMRMVTNGELPEDAIIIKPAVFIVFGGRSSIDGVRERICTVSVAAAAAVSCFSMGYAITPGSRLTEVAAAVAGDGLLAFASAREDYGNFYRLIISTAVDTHITIQSMSSRSSGNYYGYEHVRLAFDYHNESWNLYELGVARGPNNETWEPVLRRCSQDYYPYTCTTYVTPIDYSVLSPNRISGVDLAVMPNGVPTISFTSDRSVDGTKSTYIYTTTCPSGVSPCALFPLERPLSLGNGDGNPRLFVLDGYIGTVWQRESGAGMVGELTLHHLGIGIITFPRIVLANFTGPNYAIDVEGSQAAALWVGHDAASGGTRHTWLVYNANQTYLPMSLR